MDAVEAGAGRHRHRQQEMPNGSRSEAKGTVDGPSGSVTACEGAAHEVKVEGAENAPQDNPPTDGRPAEEEENGAGHGGERKGGGGVADTKAASRFQGLRCHPNRLGQRGFR
jgi:hypothetical protein